MENYFNMLWPYAAVIAFGCLEGAILGYVYAIWTRFIKWLHAFALSVVMIVVALVLHMIWGQNFYILLSLGISSLVATAVISFKNDIAGLKNFRPWKY